MYAVATILDRPLRFCLTVGGVALCVTLALFLQSVYRGVADGSVEYVRASDADLWMFIASGGGLTAGRVDADGSLFPYQTVDKLHDAHHHPGLVTLIRI